MPPKIIKTKAINRLLHGWGYVEGKWVYVPLWDPPKELTAFRQLFAAAALADGAKLIGSKPLAERLNAAAGDLLARSARGFTTAWEDGDPICPPWPRPFPPRPPLPPIWPPIWPPVPFPWPPRPTPGPDPVPDLIHDFVLQLDPTVRNAVVGDLVSKIGEQLGDRTVTQIGREIVKAG